MSNPKNNGQGYSSLSEAEASEEIDTFVSVIGMSTDLVRPVRESQSSSNVEKSKPKKRTSVSGSKSNVRTSTSTTKASPKRTTQAKEARNSASKTSNLGRKQSIAGRQTVGGPRGTTNSRATLHWVVGQLNLNSLNLISTCELEKVT